LGLDGTATHLDKERAAQIRGGLRRAAVTIMPPNNEGNTMAKILISPPYQRIKGVTTASEAQIRTISARCMCSPTGKRAWK